MTKNGEEKKEKSPLEVIYERAGLTFDDVPFGASYTWGGDGKTGGRKFEFQKKCPLKDFGKYTVVGLFQDPQEVRVYAGVDQNDKSPDDGDFPAIRITLLKGSPDFFAEFLSGPLFVSEFCFELEALDRFHMSEEEREEQTFTRIRAAFEKLGAPERQIEAFLEVFDAMGDEDAEEEKKPDAPEEKPEKSAAKPQAAPPASQA